MRAGVVVFPGTNCDRDTLDACLKFGWESDFIWHFETNLDDYDVIFLPGGFSYGDYIRSGRLAKFSPVMSSVKKFVDNNKGFVVGICNGFQILCECGLLPGVLTDNLGARFICKTQKLKLEDEDIDIELPIAHGEGRYYAEKAVIENLKNKDMIFLTYAENPNGSLENIAGLYDRERRIIGMMPHPERAFFDEIGGIDGRKIFEVVEKGLKNAVIS